MFAWFDDGPIAASSASSTRAAGVTAGACCCAACDRPPLSLGEARTDMPAGFVIVAPIVAARPCIALIRLTISVGDA